mgnify:CR=1 FL=1
MPKFNSKYIKPFKNIYFIIFFVFCLWMLFFDAHSYLYHRELNKEIDELNYQKQHYIKEMRKDHKEINKLSTPEGTEKFARESYYMKKPNEDIFIIEYEDSIKQKQNNE